MRIGIDFDNTIACYDGVFHKAAIERGLIPDDLDSSKNAVRDYLNGSAARTNSPSCKGTSMVPAWIWSHPTRARRTS